MKMSVLLGGWLGDCNRLYLGYEGLANMIMEYGVKKPSIGDKW